MLLMSSGKTLLAPMLTDRYGPMADVEAARGDRRVGAEVKLQLGGVA